MTRFKYTIYDIIFGNYGEGMEMKIKFFIIGTLFLLLACSFFTATISAAERHGANVSFAKEPTYELVNRLTKNNKVIGWVFHINVYLQNTGDRRSEELIVNLSDEEGFSLMKQVILEPDENKTVTFTWSTISSKDQQLTIKYFPADLDTIWNKYNSGITTLNVIVEGKDSIPATGIPGFEIPLLMLTLIFIVLYQKKKKTL